MLLEERLLVDFYTGTTESHEVCVRESLLTPLDVDGVLREDPRDFLAQSVNQFSSFDSFWAVRVGGLALDSRFVIFKRVISCDFIAKTWA